MKRSPSIKIPSFFIETLEAALLPSKLPTAYSLSFFFNSSPTSGLKLKFHPSLRTPCSLPLARPPAANPMPALAEAPRSKVSGLSDLEIESIEMFINFLRLLGWPKSVGEIYGLLFVSAQPLAMDDIMARTGMSLGAASQGLKLLREFGAVRTVYIPGARKDHYLASGELSRFATSYIEEELLPRMRTAQERIKRMERMMQSLPEADRQLPAERIDRLKYWLGKGQKVVPWLVRFLKL
jgi:DNA-binding transcriptional regulator GbsR (MarR family)